MNARDAQAWQLQRAGWSVRGIARELGMAASSVQRCLQRAQKLAMASAPGQVVAVLTDELACEDVTTEADVARLDPLERHRLRYVPGEFGDAERARVAAERAAWWKRQKAERDEWESEHPGADWYASERFKVEDGQHWREHCDAAMSDDSGTDAEDDW